MKLYVPFFNAILLGLGIVPAAVAQPSALERANLEPASDETSSYSSSRDRGSEESELPSSAIAPIALETLLSPKRLPSRKPKWKEVQIQELDAIPNASSKEVHADVLPNREISHKRESDFPLTEAEHLNQEFLPTRTSSSKVESIAQAASVISVTGVRLNRTDRGLEVILETPGDKEPRVFKTRYGNTLAIDVPNTQLRLPKEQGFRQENPTSGIASVEVVQQNPNSIRVIVTGTEAVPTAEVVPSPEGVAFSVTSPTPAAEQPPTPEAEAPAPTERPETEPPAPTPTAPERAEPAPQTAEGEEPIELVVTATRTEEEITDQPRSVTVIDREEIEQQADVSRNLPNILSQTVPGFFSQSQGANTGQQNIRGRPPQVLIDGVPIRSNLSTIQPRALRSIDPAAVERIEVVRGPSALYGDGGTGGVINIITRDRTKEQFTARSQAAVDIATTGDEDNVGNFFSQFLAFNEGDFDFTFSLSREYTGSFFDAEGDRIPDDDSFDLSNTETLNVLGKLGVDLSEEQRLQLTVNRFDDDQVFSVVADPSILETPGIQKAVGIETDRRYVEGPEPELQNTVINLSYTHENLLNSRVQAQAYYRDNLRTSPAIDARDIGADPGLISTDFNREQLGARLQVETPFSSALSLLWGADYSDEDVSTLGNVFDEGEFDESGGEVLRKTGELVSVPPYDFTSLGLFAQLQWDLSERWALRGGVRHAQLGLSVDDYTVQGYSLQPDREVEGGEIDFNDTLFNVGVVYDLTDEVNLFASFSQGYSAPDFGRLLRAPGEEFTSVEEDLDVTRPQKVDSYEIGVRSNWQNVQVSLAGFYNESELGVRTEFDPTIVSSRIVRDPQRFYGLEASLDWQPGGGWGLGGIVSWTEGEFENEEGDFLPITSRDISPLKLTTYVEHETQSGWLNRLQALYVGSRDRAFEEEVDPVPIESYLTVDFISSIPLWGGQLELSVENLFNEQYFPVINQLRGVQVETSNFAARGRIIRLGYSIEW